MGLVRLENVSVEYPIYNSVARSIRHTLFRSVGGKVEAHNQTVCVRALDNISFELKDGDRLGLIGHNGAGKTTLLRTIAGVYYPTGGSITVQGNRSSLTDIGMGMDPELTGYDNIVNKLVLMGMSFTEARAHIDDVGEFSELGEYLALPMRTYSQGMYLRLAFAVATTIIPDILILDEMIGAGDARFKEKAKRRTEEFLEQTKIMVISSHEIPLVRNYCNKVIWLKEGKIHASGATEDVLAEYLIENGA